ncbi:hypothetical protein BJ322DRAFT_1203138 [Thelephora terrestris]|uniref:RING-type domain-containing protein n=1 Tax=Thelephora terrestris TaxID=56493 RepID=A0A9P6LBT7_9AGAM|nr:hypothetical protein BJ322DRAFT_1203138 [Thelephora terrestris]
MASSSIAGDSVYDFWEAVTCAKCHLRFVPDNGGPPLAPFWITECGHILCNNHLNADQICSYCGDRPINLAPLQREMEPPVSDWFRSLPYAIDSLANSVKFQQATMGSLLKYYREKIYKQRSTIEQLKKERAELVSLRRISSINEQLQQENEYMRGQLEYTGFSDPGDSSRPTKRQRLDYHGQSFSSPRRMSTPVRPDRLTFPPDHQEPDLSRSDDGYQNVCVQSA